MAVERKTAAWKQIRDILLVLALGVIGALIISVGAIYYFSPGGSYKAGNILLSLEVSAQLSYNERNPGNANQTHYTFDKIEFLYFNDKSQEWVRKEIGLQAYAVFFKLISDERGLSVVPEQLAQLFNKGKPAVLTIMVKSNGQGGQKTLSFQELQIIQDADYYRIQLHDQEESRSWVYFYHQGIYQEAMQILLE